MRPPELILSAFINVNLSSTQSSWTFHLGPFCYRERSFPEHNQERFLHWLLIISVHSPRYLFISLQISFLSENAKPWTRKKKGAVQIHSRSNCPKQIPVHPPHIYHYTLSHDLHICNLQRWEQLCCLKYSSKYCIEVQLLFKCACQRPFRRQAMLL